MLSDRMRDPLKGKEHSPFTGVELWWSALMTKYAGEVAVLEARLQAHIENEGDECPLCDLEARLQQAVDDGVKAATDCRAAEAQVARLQEWAREAQWCAAGHMDEWTERDLDKRLVKDA